jgi:hypothetical protein
MRMNMAVAQSTEHSTRFLPENFLSSEVLYLEIYRDGIINGIECGGGGQSLGVSMSSGAKLIPSASTIYGTWKWF